MAPVLEAELPTLGLWRTFPQDLVYGPLKYIGLALPNLYTVQGMEHISTIMEFGNNMKTLTGQLLKENLKALKLERSRYPSAPHGLPRYGTLATSSWTQHTWHLEETNTYLLWLHWPLYYL
jgi:hypothetical protein